MEIKCTCPYCTGLFTVTIDDPRPVKGKKNYSEEERRRRSERMKEMRARGIGGRPKGIKEKGHRSTYGRARGPSDGRQG